MDFSEIVSAANGLKIAGQIAVGLIDLKTTTEVQAKAIELNQKILSAQSDLFAASTKQTALVERIRDLEDQIARMKDWGAQKRRYKLMTPIHGCVAYVLQKAMSNG